MRAAFQRAWAEGTQSYLARRLLEEREDPPPQLPVKSRVELEGGRPLARLRDSSGTRVRGGNVSVLSAEATLINPQRGDVLPVRLHGSVFGREAREARQLSPPAALHPLL